MTQYTLRLWFTIRLQTAFPMSISLDCFRFVARTNVPNYISKHFTGRFCIEIWISFPLLGIRLPILTDSHLILVSQHQYTEKYFAGSFLQQYLFSTIKILVNLKNLLHVWYCSLSLWSCKPFQLNASCAINLKSNSTQLCINNITASSFFYFLTTNMLLFFKYVY